MFQGITVSLDRDNNLIIARILQGSLADKQGEEGSERNITTTKFAMKTVLDRPHLHNNAAFNAMVWSGQRTRHKQQSQ